MKQACKHIYIMQMLYTHPHHYRQTVPLPLQADCTTTGRLYHYHYRQTVPLQADCTTTTTGRLYHYRHTVPLPLQADCTTTTTGRLYHYHYRQTVPLKPTCLVQQERQTVLGVLRVLCDGHLQPHLLGLHAQRLGLTDLHSNPDTWSNPAFYVHRKLIFAVWFNLLCNPFQGIYSTSACFLVV